MSSRANSWAQSGILPRATMSRRAERIRSGMEKPDGHNSSHWPHRVQELIIWL